MLRAIIFDLDETLIDRREAMRQFLLNQYQRFSDQLATTAEAFASAVLFHQEGGYADKRETYALALSSDVIDSALIGSLMNDFTAVYGEVAGDFPALSGRSRAESRRGLVCG